MFCLKKTTWQIKGVAKKPWSQQIIFKNRKKSWSNEKIQMSKLENEMEINARQRDKRLYKKLSNEIMQKNFFFLESGAEPRILKLITVYSSAKWQLLDRGKSLPEACKKYFSFVKLCLKKEIGNYNTLHMNFLIKNWWIFGFRFLVVGTRQGSWKFQQNCHYFICLRIWKDSQNAHC